MTTILFLRERVTLGKNPLDVYREKMQQMEQEMPWWEQAGSGCRTAGSSGLEKNHPQINLGSHCGYRAWRHGYEQSVLSYSIHGNESISWTGLSQILEDSLRFYPNWKVRFHTDPRQADRNLLCDLLSKFEHLAVCDVRNLPAPLGDVVENRGADPTLWRLLPLGDSQVVRFIVRNSDSTLSERERAAVAEWKASGARMHVMRDHPQHTSTVMAGMTGIYQSEDHRDWSLEALDKLLQPLTEDVTEQLVMQAYLYNPLFPWIMEHSSYPCEKFPRSRPFPTRRTDGFFVGSHQNQSCCGVCPVACRPTLHQDWVYC